MFLCLLSTVIILDLTRDLTAGYSLHTPCNVARGIESVPRRLSVSAIGKSISRSSNRRGSARMWCTRTGCRGLTLRTCSTRCVIMLLLYVGSVVGNACECLVERLARMMRCRYHERGHFLCRFGQTAPGGVSELCPTYVGSISITNCLFWHSARSSSSNYAPMQPF